MLNRCSRIRSCLLAMAILAAPLASVARAADAKDIVKMIPADAWGFAVVKSLDNLDKKAAQLSKEFGLPIPPVKQLALGMLQIGEGFDSTSAIGVVAMNIQKYGDKGVAIFVPAKDAMKMLSKFEPGEAKDGIMSCTIAGEPMFASIKGTTVIVSPNEEVCTKVAKSEKMLGADLAEARADVLDKADIFISLSMGALLESYKEQIGGFMPMITGGMGGNAQTVEQFLAMAKQIEWLDLSVRIDDAGLNLGSLVSPRKDSDLEKWFGDCKNASDSLVGWLPKERFLIAAGALGNYSAHAEKFGSEGMIVGLLKQATAHGMDEAKVKPVLDDLVSLAKSIDRYAMSVSLLPEGSGGLFGATLVFETKDATKFVEGVRKVYKGLWSISDDQEMEKLKKAVTHKPDAETIDGKKIDTVAVNPKELAGEDADVEDLKKAERILGKDITLRFGAVSDKHVVIAFGGGEARFKAIMAAIKGGSEAALSADAGIKAVGENQPRPRSSESFIAVDSILHAMKAGSKAVGEDDPIPFDMAPVDAPVTLSGAQHGRIARGEIFIPKKLMIAFKKAYDDSSKSAAHNFDEEDEGKAGKDGEGHKAGDHEDKAKPSEHKSEEDKPAAKDAPKKDEPKKEEPSKPGK